MMRSRLGKTLILFLFVYLIWVLGKGVWQLYEASGRLGEAKGLLVEQEKKNEELKKKMTMVQSRGFIEKEAREKLNLQLPGETVMILQGLEIREQGVEQTKTRELANWQRWWELFR